MAGQGLTTNWIKIADAGQSADVTNIGDAEILLGGKTGAIKQRLPAGSIAYHVDLREALFAKSDEPRALISVSVRHSPPRDW